MEKTRKREQKNAGAHLRPFCGRLLFFLRFFCVAHFFCVSFRRLKNVFFSVSGNIWAGARGIEKKFPTKIALENATMSGRVASGAATWREYNRAGRNA